MSGSDLVKYGSWDDKEVSKEREEASAADGEFMKLVVGRNVVRFMPPPIGRGRPFRVVYQHYIKVIGADKPVTFACPRMELHQPCPACAHADRLRATKNSADYELAGDFVARRRVFANVIDPPPNAKVLKQGLSTMTQAEATSWQNILLALGYGSIVGPVDGKWGLKTTTSYYPMKVQRWNRHVWHIKYQVAGNSSHFSSWRTLAGGGCDPNPAGQTAGDVECSQMLSVLGDIDADRPFLVALRTGEHAQRE